MISAIWILSQRGSALAFRDYRGDILSSARLIFVKKVIASQMLEESSANPPVFMEEGIVFAYEHVNNSQGELYFVAASGNDANVFTMFEVLGHLRKVLKAYFGEVSENTITANLSLVYELLDEVLDFGYPQVFEPDLLKTYIQQRSYLDALKEVVGKAVHKQDVVAPTAVTGAVSWRRDGIHYSKNEYFLDVVENLEMVLTPEERVLGATIRGSFKCISQLSGTPSVKLGLNDRVRFDKALGASVAVADAESGKVEAPIDLEDVKFHQCVRVQKFEQEGALTFIPPDGAFDLMNYRISPMDIKPLITCNVKEVAAPGGTGFTYHVKLQTHFQTKSIAKEIVVSVPVPSDSDTPVFRPSVGSVKYVPARSCFEWVVRQMAGKQSATLQASFGLPSCRASTEETTAYIRKPVLVKFDVPYYSLSGAQVRYVKISEKSGYDSYPWVRYLASGVITVKRV